MSSALWVIAPLRNRILLIVITLVKGKVYLFLALLLASVYVGAVMGMDPLKMAKAMEEGIGATQGLLTAVSIARKTRTSPPAAPW